MIVMIMYYPLLADNNYADVLQYLNAFVASSIDENNDCFLLASRLRCCDWTEVHSSPSADRFRDCKSLDRPLE